MALSRPGDRSELPKPARPDPDPFNDPIAIAVVDLIAEHGYSAVGERDLAERAGIGMEEFRRRFADKEACVLRSFELFVEDYEWRAESAYRSQPDWRRGLRATAYETADWMIENPNLIRFAVVELLEAKSEMIRVRREEALSYGARIIDRGRTEAADPDLIPDSAALLAIGSASQLLMHRLQSGADIDPMPFVPQLLYLAVRPYVGEEAAQEELTAPRPSPWRG